jgi:hypothetical protein
LVRRFRLVPPIDLRDLIERFADVEVVAIPGDCDGLVVGLHGPADRPVILVRSEGSKLRRRFTLAHELGHVLMPWHLGGGFLCDTGRVVDFDESVRASAAEAQANRFAAELLVPSTWLDERLAELGADRAEPLLAAIREANISAEVACLRLMAALPAGHVFVIPGSGNRVVLSGQTPGTGVYPPDAGEELDRARLDRFSESAETVSYGTRRVLWWRVMGTGERVALDTGPRSSTEVLRDALGRHTGGVDLQQSLSSVVGAAYGNAFREGDTAAEALLVRFRGRFAKERGLPDGLLHDDDFELWLRKRALELAARARER